MKNALSRGNICITTAYTLSEKWAPVKEKGIHTLNVPFLESVLESVIPSPLFLIN